MARPKLHWRYLRAEASHRWKRTALTVAGIAMAVTLVLLLDVLGRAFSDVSTLPFKSLSADLLVQRGATEDALPNQMGVILPYSAQPMTATEMARLAGEDGVEAASGFVLLWNLGDGQFYSISGLDLAPDAALLGPAKVRDWLLKGRMPAPASHEVLIERHYGAFYQIKPGATVSLSGQDFTVSGVVDIQGGGLAAAALVATLLFGAMGERRREAAILRTLGWSRRQTRRQLIGEAALQGLIGRLGPARGGRRHADDACPYPAGV